MAKHLRKASLINSQLRLVTQNKSEELCSDTEHLSEIAGILRDRLSIMPHITLSDFQPPCVGKTILARYLCYMQKKKNVTLKNSKSAN